MDAETDLPVPSLLVLDAFCLVHISQFLTCPVDLARLQCSCKILYRLLRVSDVWAKVLELNHGGVRLQLTGTAAATGSSSSGLGQFLPNQALCGLLHRLREEDLHPLRFVALFTDGGVDTGTLHYWADHAFIPNSWAPFCAKYSENVNLLAILRTGPDATGELSHRKMMIGCLKWVLPVLQNPMPVNLETDPVDPAQLSDAAENLSTWKTQRLESFFCQMAARAAVKDPLGLSMLRGLPAAEEARRAQQEGRPVDPSRAMEERREAARVLGQGIQMRTWYDRAYRLKFFQEPQQQLLLRPQADAGAAGGWARGLGQHPIQWLPAHGGGGAGAGRSVDSPYVLDEMAVRSELMTPEAASCLAILHGLAVSREGRLSCPVQSGALLAGLLPPDWPHTAMEAMAAAEPTATGDRGTAAVQHLGGAAAMAAYEAMMRACVEQPTVRALNDKQDAESIFAACASGQLPPWVRHVTMEHAEYIELLPPYMAAQLADAGELGAGAGAGSSSSTEVTGVAAESAAGGSGSDSRASGSAPGPSRPPTASVPSIAGIPKLHPVIWFRFTEHVEYSRRRLSSRARSLLRHVAGLSGDAAELLGEDVDQVLEALRTEVAALAGNVTTGAAGDASSSRSPLPPPAPPLNTSSPLPESLSAALQRAIRLSDRLTSLATALAVLAPELRESAGFTLPEGAAQGMLQAAMSMKADLSSVGQWLAAVQERARTAQVSQAQALQRRPPREAGGRGFRGTAEQEAKEEDGVKEEEHKGEEKMNVDENVGADAAGPLPENWLEEGMRAEVRALWQTLDGVLGAASRQVRTNLTQALRQQQDAATRASEAKTPGLDMVERRNEELLRRLRIQPLPPVAMPTWATAPASPAAAAAAAAASASPPRNNSGGDGAAARAPQALTAAQLPTAAPDPGAPALEAPPPAGWAADRLFDPLLQQDVDAGRVVLPEADEDGHRVLHLAARLQFPVAANAVVFKAIRPENLMAMVGWDENEAPNVDVQYVALQGRVVRLPPGVHAVPGL